MMSSLAPPFYLPPSRSSQSYQKPTSQTLPTHLLSNFASPSELKQVHAHLIKANAPLSVLPLSRVASVCAFSPTLPYALQIFQRLHHHEKPAIFYWNSCLKALAEGASPPDAISLFQHLRRFDVLPDTFTCSFVLKACSRLLDLSHARVVHGLMEKLEFGSDLFLQNMLLQLYASCEAMGDARRMFDKMPERDVVTWNIMIAQLVKREEDAVAAFELFSRMPQKNVRSWTSMIAGYVQCGKPSEAVHLFLDMEAAGLRPNEVTVVAAVAACADLGALDLGRRIHKYSDRNGFRTNTRVSNAMITMYAKCGCLEDARRVFNEMEERTVVSWSAMIGGLAQHGQAGDAFQLFYQMTQTGIMPNGVTFLGLLHACNHMGLVNEGRQFFSQMMEDYGIAPEIEHYGCMVDLYSRAGLLQEAREFITKMPIKPNGVVWGALLGGCKVHRNIDMAEEAMAHLLEQYQQNDGYYIVLSNIYAQAGRWEDVARVRKLMRDKGVKKTQGWSSITVDGVVHKFVAGDETHPQAEEISLRWEMLLAEMKSKGYAPNTSVVLLDVEENEKHAVLNRHSEKLALVFGLLRTQPGTPIRIMKNLRVCEDCHAAFKLISNMVDREIVVRDRNRFHCFKGGGCSCKDYW